MKFGLNVPKGKRTAGAPVRKAASVFGQEDSDDDGSDQEQQVLSAKEQAKKDRSRINQQLETSARLHQKIQEAHEQAVAEDPNIYDYDAVYDDLKAAERQRTQAKKGKNDQKAKYIHNLLAMAEVRKRDRLLAEDKKIAREREAEGDEFADKDVFMTESYKQQKAELERIEREERQREENAAKKSNVNVFYKQMLEKKEAEHRALMQATKERKNKASASVGDDDEDDSAKQMLAEATKKGARLNDSNEVVDKRELLGAGLNVAKRPNKFGSFASLASTDEGVRQRQEEYEAYKRRKVDEYEARRKAGRPDDERVRLSKQLEQQMLETKKKAEEAEARDLLAKQEAAATKRTTDESALSAKERYLARKKQKSQQ
ncbi:coiled-coil domain-containing protein 55-domain containing protein [Gongronella butleri]|nr:coiled-coil domain-containing protein 55-domain containing protein [Gongronella butleri]